MDDMKPEVTVVISNDDLMKGKATIIKTEYNCDLDSDLHLNLKNTCKSGLQLAVGSVVSVKKQKIDDDDGTVSTKVSYYSCTTCGFVCSSLQKLKVHMQHEHPEKVEGAFRCKSCPYVCTSSATLAMHKRRHHPRPKKELNAQCSDCEYAGPSTQALYNHMQRKHRGKGNAPHSCFVCSYAGYSSKALEAHMRRMHPDALRVHKCMECRELDCGLSFSSVKELRKHLSSVHGFVIREFNVVLKSQEEFKTWKRNYEAESQVSFVKARGSVNKMQYVCHRSGTYKPNGRGIRSMKSQGSCKLGFNCTATMVANIEDDGSVKVTVNPFHYGHGFEMQHLRIPEREKLKIRDKLSSGISMNDIIQEAQASAKAIDSEATDELKERIAYLKMTDLRNFYRRMDITIPDEPPDDVKVKTENIPVEEPAYETETIISVSREELKSRIIALADVIDDLSEDIVLKLDKKLSKVEQIINTKAGSSLSESSPSKHQQQLKDISSDSQNKENCQAVDDLLASMIDHQEVLIDGTQTYHGDHIQPQTCFFSSKHKQPKVSVVKPTVMNSIIAHEVVIDGTQSYLQ